MSQKPIRLVDAGWDQELTEAIRADSSEVRIICPFIKEDALKRLRLHRLDDVQVITRFNLSDIANGVSDIEALRVLLKAPVLASVVSETSMPSCISSGKAERSLRRPISQRPHSLETKNSGWLPMTKSSSGPAGNTSMSFGNAVARRSCPTTDSIAGQKKLPVTVWPAGGLVVRESSAILARMRILSPPYPSFPLSARM